MNNHPNLTTTITALSHDGRGIASVNGKTIFISGALPHETVSYRLTKKHNRFNEGVAIEILQKAPERVTPSCAHFSICGGCSMQHVDVNAQIQFKQAALLEQLHHFGKVTPQHILPPLTANAWGYRRKARLGVRYVQKKDRLLVGFREKFSHFLAEIESCPVLHPAVGTHILGLREVIMKLTQFAHIAQIEVAVGDEETALVFRHLQPLSSDDIERLRAFAASNHFTIYLQPNPPEKLQKIWPQDHNDFLTYHLPDYDLTMQFHPLDFIQVNGEANQLLLKQALQLLNLQETDTVLDLFCGLGNFTLPIARFAKHVTGIEGSQEMVSRATLNAAHNDLHNTQFYTANLAEPNPNAPWLQKKYDKILLDPPRTGAKEMIAYCKQLAAKKIVYVSCNPATFARDAGELVSQYGYTLSQVGLVNMFPHTSHIEAIGLFEK